MGRSRHVANLVGTLAGEFAVEPWAVAALKCACFCYLGLELALTRGPVALLGTIAAETHLTIRFIAQILTWATAAFCLLRGLPVLLAGWPILTQEVVAARRRKSSVETA